MSSINIYNDVITGEWFTPFFNRGFIESDSIAVRLLRHEEPDIANVLNELKEQGLLLLAKTPSEKPSYKPTPQLWMKREEVLRTTGRRSPYLVKQNDFDLDSLIIAIAMNRHIINRRTSGFGIRPEVSLPEIELYLYEFGKPEIARSIESLFNKNLLSSRQTKSHEGNIEQFLGITPKGERHYKLHVQPIFKLGDNESILDINQPKSIQLFWSWQSDFVESSLEIKGVIKNVIKILNENYNPVSKLVLTEATEAGEGSIRIDGNLQKKIEQADYFIADMTPVFRFDKRLYPNVNVLIEIGFALASKKENRNFIITKDRNIDDIRGFPDPKGEPPKFPFDIDHVSRISYETPQDLEDDIFENLKASLIKENLIFPDKSES